MKFNTLRTAAAAILLAAVGGTAVAQAPPTRVPPVREVPTERVPAAYHAKDVLGTKVYIGADLAVGTVDDIVFDEAGNLDYLVVASEGKLVTVPWEAAKFNPEKKTAVLTLTAEQYKVIPTYTVKEYPNYYSPTYRTQVYKSYNLTPRELRRLDNGKPVR